MISFRISVPERDIVILYPYQDQPDVLREILMKGNLVEINPDRITVQLRNGQQNKDIIGTKTDTFALENGHIRLRT